MVAPEKRLKIVKCKARIKFSKPQREATYQVTLDVLKLSPCYPAFLITTEVLEIYMHQFWKTIKKIKDTDAYQFKLDKKKCRIDTEVFREILQICLTLIDQDFVEPPSDEELVPFFQELGYSSKYDMLFAIHIDQMHPPWRTFAAIINRCISGKSTGLDRLKPSRAQILWGMFYQKNVDYVALLWEDFMFQPDNRDLRPARKENMPYPRFTKVTMSHFISKDKTISMRNIINLHTIRDDSLLGTLKFVSKTEDYQKFGALLPEEMINQDIKDSQAYKTYLDFAIGKATPKKARKFKKIASLLRKLSPFLEEELAKKPKQAKKLDPAKQAKTAKKSSTVQTAGVVIRDAPGVFVSKKKEPAKVDRGKGMDLMSDVALLEAVQLKKSLKKSKQDTHMLHTSGSGDGGLVPNQKVPDGIKTNGQLVINEECKCSERTDSDKDGDLILIRTDDEEEECEELYKDVNVRLKDAEHKEEGKGDAEMTDVGRDDKTEGPMQSSSVSSDFASQFLNLDNVPPADNEVVTMMNVKVRHEEPSTQAPSLLTIHVTGFLKLQLQLQQPFLRQSRNLPHLLFHMSYTTEFKKKAQAKKKRYIELIKKSVKDINKDKVKSQLPHILPKEVSDYATSAATSLIEFELKKILLDKMQKSKSYRGAQEHKELYNRDHEDKDKDEDPPTESDQGLKKQNTSKDVEPSKGSKSKESKSSSSKGAKSQPKSSGKSAQAEESVFEAADIEVPQNQESDLGNTDDQPNVEVASEREWFKKPERPSTPDPYWNAKKSVDFRPPQTWISKIAQAVKPPLSFDELMSTPIDFTAYVMNNLKIDNLTRELLVGPAYNLLKGIYKSLPLIEDRGRQVVPVDYFINNDLEYLKGGRSSRKYTNSTTKTKAAKYDDIQGIEDMVPSKISNLERDVIFDLNVALRMFTRRVVILKHVEDLQLGVKRYQKKLNITKPETFRFDISNRTPYTAYNNPQGIIYLDKYKRNRLMRSDELYKFSDGTLTSVRTVLHDIDSNLRMDYLPKRIWCKVDKKRSHIMIKEIDQHLFERRLMRNLEKFVGGRDYGEDFRLLERTI
ncbi:hypothetical protein Tco_1352681 [Tanacetum coccineum]